VGRGAAYLLSWAVTTFVVLALKEGEVNILRWPGWAFWWSLVAPRVSVTTGDSSRIIVPFGSGRSMSSLILVDPGLGRTASSAD